MIKLLGPIPKRGAVACSGGIDSMAALHFLYNGRYWPDVAFFDHGNEMAKKELELVRSVFEDHHNVANFFRYGKIRGGKPKGESWEEYWRNERYAFLDSLDCPVITGHHLNDVIETWIFSSLHGQSKLIPYKRNQVIRPFLLTEKKELEDFVKRNNVPFVSDTSNEDMSLMRNYIRKNIVPHALNVNPGLGKVLRKRLIEKFEIIE